MKTALELLGDDACASCTGPHHVKALELVARRAREEMREAAALELARHSPPLLSLSTAQAAIRALPVEATK